MKPKKKLIYISKCSMEFLQKKTDLFSKKDIFQTASSIVSNRNKNREEMNQYENEREKTPFIFDQWKLLTSTQKVTYVQCKRASQNESLFCFILNVSQQKLKTICTVVSVLEKQVKEEHFFPSTYRPFSNARKRRNRNAKNIKPEKRHYIILKSVFDRLFSSFGFLELDQFNLKSDKKSRKSSTYMHLHKSQVRNLSQCLKAALQCRFALEDFIIPKSNTFIKNIIENDMDSQVFLFESICMGHVEHAGNFYKHQLRLPDTTGETEMRKTPQGQKIKFTREERDKIKSFVQNNFQTFPLTDQPLQKELQSGIHQLQKERIQKNIQISEKRNQSRNNNRIEYFKDAAKHGYSWRATNQVENDYVLLDDTTAFTMREDPTEKGKIIYSLVHKNPLVIEDPWTNEQNINMKINHCPSAKKSSRPRKRKAAEMINVEKPKVEEIILGNTNCKLKYRKHKVKFDKRGVQTKCPNCNVSYNVEKIKPTTTADMENGDRNVENTETHETMENVRTYLKTHQEEVNKILQSALLKVFYEQQNKMQLLFWPTTQILLSQICY